MVANRLRRVAIVTVALTSLAGVFATAPAGARSGSDDGGGSRHARKAVVLTQGERSCLADHGFATLARRSVHGIVALRLRSAAHACGISATPRELLGAG